MKWLLRLALITTVLLTPALVQAHTAIPAKIVDAQAGPYAFEVYLFADIAHAGQAYDLMVLPKTPGFRLTAQLLPAPGLSATPLRGQVAPDPDVPGAFDVHFIDVTTGGDWTLLLGADGPAGSGEARVPLKAVPPPAIPIWLGWLVGLIPVYGLLWFAYREWRRFELTQRAA